MGQESWNWYKAEPPDRYYDLVQKRHILVDIKGNF